MQASHDASHVSKTTQEKSESQLSEARSVESTLQESLSPGAPLAVIKDFEDLDLIEGTSFEITEKEAATHCDSHQIPTAVQTTSTTTQELCISQLPSGQPSITQNTPSVAPVSTPKSLHSTPSLSASAPLPPTNLSQVISSLTPVSISQSLALPSTSSVTQVQSQPNANISTTIFSSPGSEVKTAKKHRLETPLVCLPYSTQFNLCLIFGI